jgi:hypothetical protein
MAGIVSGSRQTNSTTRRSRGSRRRTQITVGTSSTSMSSTVSTTSPAESVMPAHRSGYVSPSFRQSTSSRQVSNDSFPPAPRVVNSSIASSGSRKNVASRVTTTQRNAR